MSNKKIVHLYAIILMVVWGVSYLSIKVVVGEVEPTLTAFYRFFIASIILFIVLKVKYPEEKVLKEDKVKMALGGLFGVAIYFFFENYSVAFTSASNVAILISSIPVFTLVSQRIIFKERINVFKFLGATLSVLGIVVVVAAKERVSLFSTGTLGDILALGAAFSWVIYNIVTSKFKGEYKSITVTTYQALWGTLFLSPSLFFSKITMPSPIVIANILYLAIICSFISYVMYIYCLKTLGATVITTYINLQPIVSITAAAIILKEKITFWQIVGCIVIIAGVFLVNIDDKFIKNKFIEKI